MPIARYCLSAEPRRTTSLIIILNIFFFFFIQYVSRSINRNVRAENHAEGNNNRGKCNKIIIIIITLLNLGFPASGSARRFFASRTITNRNDFYSYNSIIPIVIITLRRICYFTTQMSSPRYPLSKIFLLAVYRLARRGGHRLPRPYCCFRAICIIHYLRFLNFWK